MTYALPFTTMAVEGPERSGSGKGVPVPRRTTWVLGIASFCACEMPHQVKRNKTVNPTAPRFRRFAIIAYPPFETAPRLACWVRYHCSIKLYKKCVFRCAAGGPHHVESITWVC